MANIDITFDAKDFNKGVKKLAILVKQKSEKALNEIALEILRLSAFEVPHDKGLLQASGNKEPKGEEVIVGYNKVYAARLHEHPEYNFQKGRKGKYLEDPIKNNLRVFREFFRKTLAEIK